MPDVLIRDLSPETIKNLKGRAHRNGRSMQAELKSIIDQAAQTEFMDAEILSAKIRRMLEGRRHTDSAEVTRKGT